MYRTNCRDIAIITSTKIQLNTIKLCHHNLLQCSIQIELKWDATCLTATLNYKNNNLLSLLSSAVQNENSRIETTEAKYCYQFYKKNSNFRNSKSCRIFDEANYTRLPQNIAIFCMTNIDRNHRKWSRIPCKCYEMSWNHPFERRYINPRVTYVEKPKRLLLNPLVSGQLTRFQLFIWEIRWNK